jgi:hypothetical protein
VLFWTAKIATRMVRIRAKIRAIVIRMLFLSKR